MGILSRTPKIKFPITYIRGKEMGRKTFTVLIFLVLMLAFSVPFALARETSVEKSLLNGNWQAVIEILKKDDKKAEDPVARLIMGHACLATDQNDEGLALFLSVPKEEELKAWLEFTSHLVSKYPGSGIAHYLKGDALSRFNRTPNAIVEFNECRRL
jgi:hypothetical protein